MKDKEFLDEIKAVNENQLENQKRTVEEEFITLQSEAYQRFLDMRKSDTQNNEHENATALDYFQWTAEEVLLNYQAL